MTAVQRIDEGNFYSRQRNALDLSSKRVADRIDMDHAEYLEKESGRVAFTDEERAKLKASLV